LHAHDRWTVLLASGPSVTTLQSACDMVLALGVFLNEALGISLHLAVPQVGPVASASGVPLNCLFRWGHAVCSRRCAMSCSR